MRMRLILELDLEERVAKMLATEQQRQEFAQAIETDEEPLIWLCEWLCEQPFKAKLEPL